MWVTVFSLTHVYSLSEIKMKETRTGDAERPKLTHQNNYINIQKERLTYSVKNALCQTSSFIQVFIQNTNKFNFVTILET